MDRLLLSMIACRLSSLPTLDLLEPVYRHPGYRLSLDHLAIVTLQVKKTADGFQALAWWKTGKIGEIVAYCKKDVEITRNLYLFEKNNGFILFNDKAGRTVRVPVNWQYPKGQF